MGRDTDILRQNTGERSHIPSIKKAMLPIFLDGLHGFST